MSAAIITHAPLALWQAARDYLNLLFNLFGAPGDVAFRHTLVTKQYQLLRDWLRAGEAYMRRLLLIEAAAYDKPNTRHVLRPQRKRFGKLIGFDEDHPEQWRVSFRCFGFGARGLRPRISPKGYAPPEASRSNFHSAWPLAERYESLLRVFNNPAPYARRLATRLHATPHRVRELTAYPASTPGCIGHEAFAASDDPCARASKRFDPG